MIVGNLFHIKNTNGLFYYAVDYLRDSAAQIRKVLVRPNLVAAARQALPGCDIQACTIKGMIWEATLSALRGDILYTPTSHPLPALSNQWIVIHDTYPFTTGRKGRLKKKLLRWSLASSRCRVCYINESDTLPFVVALGVSASRRMFAPNKFPPSPASMPARHQRSPIEVVVGLVGTDSDKKNYDVLFEEVLRSGGSAQLRFLAYGHHTPYLKELKLRFQGIRLDLMESDNHALENFFSRVDLLVSVANQEGFGRPIAAALLSGLQCFLLNRAVFEEFFSPGASFFDSVPALVQALRALQATRPDEASPPFGFNPPLRALRAYDDAIALLNAGRLSNA